MNLGLVPQAEEWAILLDQSFFDSHAVFSQESHERSKSFGSSFNGE